MLGHTDNIVIIQNKIIGHKTSLYYTKHGYTITYQHNKTQNNVVIIKKQRNKTQKNIIRYKKVF